MYWEEEEEEEEEMVLLVMAVMQHLGIEDHTRNKTNQQKHAPRPSMNQTHANCTLFMCVLKVIS